MALTFWYGCNMTRHGEVIRLAMRLLDAVGIEAEATGGPASCCGSPKEADARISGGMAERTVAKFNASGTPQVATWCPSCHMNMQDWMAPGMPRNFETLHLTEVLHARRAALRPLLVHPVPARVLLHRHLGFGGRVPVNRMVAGLLALVPGLTLVEHPLAVPGHMCSSLATVPGALARAQRATLEAMAASGADTLCTIFHSCHRDAVTLERGRPIRVLNWVHLLAMAAGWPAEDGYKAWRNAADPRAAVGEAGLAAAGEAGFERLVEPELRRPPPA
ncbi:(Fe-S)-binding protein [Roseicella sp. DB1501]|uniref:(Fe-S)-binding protein n=1 Tax=Roseicella sp. DB1501 TaxID=2730925 RepID=UPI001492A6EB|nr:(Fe-S)-binding protein [Roseicella sp. DB1501]NOG69063.1 (Fe-S)-binding protein [Roseicella sp. DB1501]